MLRHEQFFSFGPFFWLRWLPYFSYCQSSWQHSSRIGAVFPYPSNQRLQEPTVSGMLDVYMFCAHQYCKLTIWRFMISINFTKCKIDYRFALGAGWFWVSTRINQHWSWCAMKLKLNGPHLNDSLSKCLSFLAPSQVDSHRCFDLNHGMNRVFNCR